MHTSIGYYDQIESKANKKPRSGRNHRTLVMIYSRSRRVWARGAVRGTRSGVRVELADASARGVRERASSGTEAASVGGGVGWWRGRRGGGGGVRSGLGTRSHGGMSATSETRPMKSTKSSGGVSQLQSGQTATLRLQ